MVSLHKEFRFYYKYHMPIIIQLFSTSPMSQQEFGFCINLFYILAREFYVIEVVLSLDDDVFVERHVIVCGAWFDLAGILLLLGYIAYNRRSV